MKTVNSLLIVAILLVTTVMTWSYFAVKGDDAVSNPQVGIGGGPETSSTNDELQTLFSARDILLVTHLTNLYDGTDTTNAGKRIEDNTQQLGNSIKRFGTAADKQALERILRSSTGQYEAYTQGLKENKQATMNLAKENLQMQSMDFGELIHKLFPTISEQRATELYNNQNLALIEVIHVHSRNDRFAKANAIEKLNAQAILLSEELSHNFPKSTKKTLIFSLL